MFVLEVIPLIAIPRNQSQLLSYFSNVELPRGSLVEVTIRNRKVLTIVMESQTLQNIKISLRKESNFSVKPINKVIYSTPVLSFEQFNLALWLSSQYFAPLGLCFNTVIPSFFNKKKYPFFSLPVYPDDHAQKASREVFIPTINLLDHHRDYEKIIKANLQKQILLVVPELPYLDYFAEKYADLNPDIIHSGLSNAKQYEIHKKAASGKPLFLIGTRIGAFLPFKNLGLIISDNQSNNSSRSDTTPRYDTGELLAYLSKEHGATLVINDIIPEINSLKNNLSDISDDKMSVLSDSSLKFVGLIEEFKDQNFSIFSRELQKEIIETKNNRGHTIIFIPRKGYSTYALCKNCSETIKCSNCSSSLVIHELSPNKKILKCHHCQKEETFIKVCPRCNKFVLEYKGVGTQKVISKLNQLFSRQNIGAPRILELSNDTASTEKEEQEIIKDFLDTPATILVATQKIMSWAYLLKADLMGIVNVELSSSFPDFKTEEKNLCQLITLLKMADKAVIQGYNTDAPIWRALESRRPISFLQDELETRKIFSYPPFSELIKLTFRQKSSSFIREAGIVAEKLKMEVKNRKFEKNVSIIGPHSAFTSKERGWYAWSIILRVKDLPLRKRNELLYIVPSRNWRIDVNPKDIL
ncbi:MAG: primosomal protein N' [bacterium]|nr:primosomal protein N' [bacterium]